MLKYIAHHTTANAREYKENGHQEQLGLHITRERQRLLPQFVTARWAR